MLKTKISSVTRLYRSILSPINARTTRHIRKRNKIRKQLLPLSFLLFFLIMVIVNDKYCYSIAIFFIHKFFAWAFVLCLPYSLSTIPYLIFFYSHPPLEEFSSIDLLSFCVENIVTFIFMNMFVGQIYCCEWILILHRWIVFLNFLPLTIHSKKNLILFYCF